MQRVPTGGRNVQNLEIKAGVGLSEDVIATWDRPIDSLPYCYDIEVKLFDLTTPMCDPILSENIFGISACRYNLGSLADHGQGLTLDVSVAGRFPVGKRSSVGSDALKDTGKHEQGPSTKVRCTWEPYFESKVDAQTHVATLLKGLCPDFQEFAAKLQRPNINLVLIGGQHHGKSSFVNHLKRFCSSDTDIPDEMEVAPPSQFETTVETKTLDIGFVKHPQQRFHFCVTDVPAFSTTADVATFREQLQGVLSGECGSGRRRQGFRVRPFAHSSQGDAAQIDAVVLVVSLLQWRDSTDEMQVYLGNIQRELKHATRDRIAMPFVVAATHRDTFLQECQADSPHEELGLAVESLKAFCNTEYVFAIANYRRAAHMSKLVNCETRNLLSVAVKLAKNRIRVGPSERNCGPCSAGLLCQVVPVFVKIWQLLKCLHEVSPH
mmetsp:Transcript_118393/g.295402  ORF Transcript_118393/g.295402 Transcript_118393/m.295402 type:complete len:436 (-) Transcript_118393:251-1558(-)